MCIKQTVYSAVSAWNLNLNVYITGGTCCRTRTLHTAHSQINSNDRVTKRKGGHRITALTANEINTFLNINLVLN